MTAQLHPGLVEAQEFADGAVAIESSDDGRTLYGFDGLLLFVYADKAASKQELTQLILEQCTIQTLISRRMRLVMAVPEGTVQ